MLAYAKSYVHLKDGVYQANKLDGKAIQYGATLYVFNNGHEVFLPNHYEIPIGWSVKMTYPIPTGLKHSPELASFFGLVNAYGVNYSTSFLLFMISASRETLYDTCKELRRLARNYLDKDMNIIPNESNNSIDITELMHEMRAKYSFSLGIIPQLVLVGDMSTILEFISPFYPLFNEVNRGWELKLVTDTFTAEFVNLLFRIGIVPYNMDNTKIVLSHKDYKVLGDLLDGVEMPYGKQIELSVASKFDIGIRTFIKINNAIAIDGISVNRLEVHRHEARRIQAKTNDA